MKRICLLGLLLVFLIAASSCSDDEIYFTQDEIVQGDIISGKQVELKHNRLLIYTEQGASVNVQGAKGQIHAVSSNEKVVTVSTSTDSKRSVYVTSKAIGEAVVTVTDEEGNSSCFTVEVKDVEELWTPKHLFVVSSDRQCVVKGATAADSAAIAADALAKATEAKFVIKERAIIAFDVSKRLYAYDQEDHLLFRGYMKLEQKGEGWAELIISDQTQLIGCYQGNTTSGLPILIREMTDLYQTAYPQVTKVQVYLPVKSLQ